jgi:excisionase family DNA binding protein
MNKKVRYAEMAKALGISERLLKNWVRDRVIPFTKIRRVVLFDPAKVESALERFERQPR